jgi:hypothetical protein
MVQASVMAQVTVTVTVTVRVQVLVLVLVLATATVTAYHRPRPDRATTSANWAASSLPRCTPYASAAPDRSGRCT